MRKYIDVNRLLSFCETHTIRQSCFDGGLIVKIGVTERNDDIYKDLLEFEEIYTSLPEDQIVHNDEYTPLCPFGATDCVCDPAYIHYAHPEWYRSMHGDKTPEEVVNETCAREDRFPHCYDDEDK